jgi:hypothetical protein
LRLIDALPDRGAAVGVAAEAKTPSASNFVGLERDKPVGSRL